MLKPEMVDFLQSGLSIVVATRDENLHCAGTRCFGLVVHDPSGVVSVYIREANQEKIIKNLQENGEIAVVTSKPTTYESYQLKGKYTGHRPADQRDKLLIERFLDIFNEEITTAGARTEMMGRSNPWPATCIDFRVIQVYNQTPGDDAGERLL